jgi:hypothetical protein
MDMARKYKKEGQFKTRWYNRTPRYWFQKDLVRPEGVRDFPEVLRLDVAPGVKPNGKPPVRIFLGTEAGQYRAERVFVWSVINTRDPARVYEIYFMKNLKGYDRTGWKTGFTNYRYGIPTMGGGKGRAIYNDVDQIYLSDVGELFDLDMGGAGMMCITERETSVMLIDCEKMIKVWTLKDAQGGKTHSFFRDTVHDHKLWARLPGEWNARDEEYSPDKSKCFHFTTLQTQPWQPFPDVLRYEPHPDGEVWFSLERAADKARFNIFTKQTPSRRFGEMIGQYKELATGKGSPDVAAMVVERPLANAQNDVAKLAKETGASSLLDFGAGTGKAYGSTGPAATHASWPGIAVTLFDPMTQAFPQPQAERYGGVIAVGALQHVPEEDIGWVLDEMFKSADSFVYAMVPSAAATQSLPNGAPAPCNVQKPEWWKGQFEAAAKRWPGIRWQVRVVENSGAAGGQMFEGSGSMARAA